jgi:hypothetical protein
MEDGSPHREVGRRRTAEEMNKANKTLLPLVLVAAFLAVSCGGGGEGSGSPRAEQDTGAKQRAAAVERARPPTTAAQEAGAPPILPDASLHPGAANPEVTQDNLNSTICKSGFTKTVRPAASYTGKLEQQQIRDEGLPGTPQDYEEDHLISLELGGAPKDEKNLWPEAYENRGAKFAARGTGSETKDKVENETKRQVCSGKMTLSEAQERIATDWRELGTDEGVL